MAHQIFVNLPVENLDRSKAFFSNLGFAFDPEFTNEKGACMVVGENIFVMLLVDSFFKTFTSKDLCDARTTTEVLVCLSCESRKEVDGLVARAVAAGRGHRPSQPPGPRLHVRARLRGPRRPHLGALFDGIRQRERLIGSSHCRLRSRTAEPRSFRPMLCTRCQAARCTRRRPEPDRPGRVGRTP